MNEETYDYFDEKEYDYVSSKVWVDSAISASVYRLAHPDTDGHSLKLMEKCCKRASTALNREGNRK